MGWGGGWFAYKYDFFSDVEKSLANKNSKEVEPSLLRFRCSSVVPLGESLFLALLFLLCVLTHRVAMVRERGEWKGKEYLSLSVQLSHLFLSFRRVS